MGNAVAGLAGLYVVLAIFGLIMTVVWIVLPFAIFGTKPLLRQILAEQRRTNELLAQGHTGTRSNEPTL